MADRERSLPGEGIVPAATRGPKRSVDPATVTTTKKYTVIGPHPVGGVATGNDVTLTLTADQEKHLVEVGHIKVSTR